MLQMNWMPKPTCQKYSMKYIYSTSQISKLSLTLCTFSITGLVAGLFLTLHNDSQREWSAKSIAR